jgi:hypothetical protein
VRIFAAERLRIRFKFWQENSRNHCSGDHNRNILCYFLVVEVDSTGSRLSGTGQAGAEWMQRDAG